jgi:hypothetical protein
MTKSASLLKEALRRSTAEVVQEPNSLRQLPSSDTRLSTELGCFCMFEVPLDFQFEHHSESVEDTLPKAQC